MYFDGSDVGLTKSGENVEVLAGSSQLRERLGDLFDAARGDLRWGGMLGPAGDGGLHFVDDRRGFPVRDVSRLGQAKHVRSAGVCPERLD